MSSDPESPSVVEGQRLGRLIRLKPAYRERYVALHRHPFPDVLEQIRASNLRNYSIFLAEHRLFSFFEYVGTDFAADMAAMAEDPTTQDWWTLTDPMQESLLPADADERWATMTELYHGGPKQGPSREATRAAFVWPGPDDPAPLEQAFEAVGDGLDAALASAPLQNYSVYRWEDRVYTYLEYTGDRLAADLDQFRARRPMRAVRDALPAPAEPSSMESVFYLA
jgi:L-rhamnose mutarotase